MMDSETEQPLYYMIGEAAEELGIGESKMRAYCDAKPKVIDSETTEGGHRRIRREVVEQLKRDGLPPLPRPWPQGDSAGRESRPGQASAAVRSAKDEVEILQAQVEVTELRRQREEALDWHRDRDARAAERQDEQRRIQKQQKADDKAARKRSKRDAKCLALAADLIPDYAPAPIHLPVPMRIQEVLQPIDTDAPEKVTTRIVKRRRCLA